MLTELLNEFIISFHYPDGFSRVQHNVFTSEDEDCDSGMVQPRLYEVNDDELVRDINDISKQQRHN